MRAVIFALLMMLMLGVSAAEPTLEIIPLKHITAEQAMTLVKPFVENSGALSGYNNQLIVRTTPGNLAQIKEILLTLDVAPRRLLITVKQDAQDEQVTDEAVVQGEIRGGDVRVSTGRNGSASREGVDVRVVRGERTAHDKNTQQIQVLEGSSAFIQIGLSIPVVERSVHASGVGPRVSNTITYKDVTTGFSILPRVSGDTVTLEISPQHSALSAQGGGSIDIAQIHTTVSGKLGEWIDLGGAVQTQSSHSSEILSSTRSQRNEDHHVFVKVEEAVSSAPRPR